MAGPQVSKDLYQGFQVGSQDPGPAPSSARPEASSTAGMVRKTGRREELTGVGRRKEEEEGLGHKAKGPPGPGLCQQLGDGH